MAGIAEQLAGWAYSFEPTAGDRDLAHRALTDTVAVALAAQHDPIEPITRGMSHAGRWATLAHVLDFDDLHITSAAHISAVLVPAVLAVGGDERAYLAGAGVMARLGQALGWEHYTSGWHATCTAGAPAAAVAAGRAVGLSERELATAMALAVPAAGGVQRSFGTHGKSLQVGFAAEAGIRAVDLVSRGASADPGALDQWFELVGGAGRPHVGPEPAVSGGLAIKLFPCCYAMQRPIAAVRALRERSGISADDVTQVTVRTRAGAIHPLIHDRPETGLEGKFSLQYAIATALLDDYPGFASFTDQAVRRPSARALMERVDVQVEPGGGDILAGKTEIEVRMASGRTVQEAVAYPPGSPARPPTQEELAAKVRDCGPDLPALLSGLTWPSAAHLLRERLTTEPATTSAGSAPVV